MSIPANLRKLLQRQGAALLGAVLLAGALPAFSGDAPGAGRVPLPNVSDRKGDHCIRDEAYMRRHHMDMLKHKRDLTMHQGVRTKEDSLQNCIACHASQKTNSVTGDDNFCQSCHNYVGVKLDCFECHSSKPKQTAFHPLVAEGQTPLAGKMRGQMGENPAQPTNAEGVK
jgi:hypothetical protein